MRRLLLVFGLVLAFRAPGLAPDELLLLTNKNVPDGRKVAEFYAAQRKVPDGRILDLDLPVGDEMPFAAYEREVLPVVREFLAKHALGTKVTCVVTCYGVPLRVAARVAAPADAAERAALAAEEGQALAQIGAAVGELEAYAKELDPAFAGGADRTINGLVQRDKAARNAIAAVVMKVNDPVQFQALMDRAEKIIAPLIGPANVAQQRLRGLSQAAPASRTPDQRREAERIQAELLAMRARYDGLQARPGDPQARAALRDLVKNELGLLEYARLIDGMEQYLETDATDAALDSELAVLHWNYYKRSSWLPNPLHYRSRMTGLPPVLMTARLDAPQVETVRNLIAAGVRAEAAGLSGKVVVDAGGHLAIDAKSPQYAAFDNRLKALAEVVRTKAALPLVLDEKREVLPPRSVDGVALYCGWYALQNYTPAFTFVPGAVGYHVASYDLTALRTPSRQWGAGLLGDGVAVTVGAVNEPFLASFPAPDEFFPLLMTGKLTLAEVYWRTTPTVSWRMVMIGDPLYRPFGARPALTPESLPEGLRPIAEAAGGAAPGGAGNGR